MTSSRGGLDPTRGARLVRALGDRPLPCALVDLDAFDENLGRLARAARGMPIRVATKSVRARALLERALAAPGYRGLLAYAAMEAVFLAEHGFDDIVVGYPTVREDEIARVAERVQQGADLVLMVDSVAQVERHAAVARRLGVTLPLCLDIDVSSRFPGLHFGVRRSPTCDVEGALAVLSAVERAGSVALVGLLAYEAQIAGVRDHLPGGMLESALVRTLKRRSMAEVRERRGAVVAALRARCPLRFVNGGGTGSIPQTREDASVTELAAGSGFFAPGLFDGYDDVPLVPAAFFALSVSRVHDSRTVVCSGGGYVASGPPAADRLPAPVYPSGGRLLPHEGAGEVQTPIAFSAGLRPALGATVLFRHAKAGELGERFTHYQLIRGEALEQTVPTYRGDGACFF